MTVITEILVQSQLESAYVGLIYDNAAGDGTAANPFIATGVIGSMGTASGKRLVFTVNSGLPSEQTFTFQPGQLDRTVNIPGALRPRGIIRTTQFGMQTIDWGLSSYGMSFE